MEVANFQEKTFTPLQRLGAVIRDLRKEAGMTQHELAKKAKLSRATIAGLEGGDSNLRMETLDKVSQALGKRMTITFE